MPYFSYRLSDNENFTYFGSAPCHGWMARLDSRNIPNTAESHIEEVKINYPSLRELSLQNQEIFREILLKFANTLPGFKGRAKAVDPFVYISSDHNYRKVETDEQLALAKETFLFDYCYHLDGLPTDVLMTYLFMFRNFASPNTFSVAKYLIDIGVPTKVACSMMSIFYASRTFRMGRGSSWGVGFSTGDSSILDTNHVTLADLRNMVYGTHVIGKQVEWGSDEAPARGYIRDGANNDAGERCFITRALVQSGLDTTIADFIANGRFSAPDGSDEGWNNFNALLTVLVGKDFELTKEVIDDEVQYLGV